MIKATIIIIITITITIISIYITHYVGPWEIESGLRSNSQWLEQNQTLKQNTSWLNIVIFYKVMS